MDIRPKDRAEEIAIFRMSVIGPLMCRVLGHGQLATELRALSTQRFRAPGAASTRTFSVPTLERWYYASREGGLDALRPQPRSDRGYAQELTPEQRELLLDIRREHPSASVPLILSTLVAEGRLDEDVVSEPTVRRLYQAHGLERRAARPEAGAKTRLRWQAERPGALWHGDVCHLDPIVVDGQTTTVRVHGLLDDASREVIALEAHQTEKEVDMLGMLVDAIRYHGKPDGIYLDNGATYRGEVLKTFCARIGITLIHAKPYDAPARGKMERFWRTMRESCANYLGQVATLSDINARLRAFAERYNATPHGSLMGKSPATVYATKPAGEGRVDEKALRDALTVRSRRKVSRDNILSIDGVAWELDQGFLAGQLVMVAHCYLVPGEAPWIEHEGKRLPLHLLDPVKNARRKRLPRGGPAESPRRSIPFDPPTTLLERSKDQNPTS
jgi:transposase InsO family protein